MIVPRLSLIVIVSTCRRAGVSHDSARDLTADDSPCRHRREDI